MFAELQVVADQLGFHFDSLVKTLDGYTVILVDANDAELRYAGATPEEAVQKAVEAVVSTLNRE